MGGRGKEVGEGGGGWKRGRRCMGDGKRVGEAFLGFESGVCCELVHMAS